MYAHRHATALLYLALVTLLPHADASPVDDEQRTPIDLRRTTLVVADIDRSLAFYRDALGMVVTYDRMIVTPRGASRDEAEFVRRLVLLRANDDYIGIIGLLQYIKPKNPRVDLKGAAYREGTAVLVFNTTELEQSFARAREVPGVVVLDEPELVNYPSYAGESAITVLISAMQDPDGFTVELNQRQ